MFLFIQFLEQPQIQEYKLSETCQYVIRWLNEDPAILEYLREFGLAENERVYGALILGYAESPDGKPNRTALERTGNAVTYI